MSEKKIGKYTLIREIARGGMAEIWLAEQRGPGGFNKELVIKKILPHLAEEEQMTQMFLDEARLVAELSHPNIGQVYELGEENGDYYIAMEYIEGLNLAELKDKLRKRGTFMPVEYATRIVCDILAALEFAHNYVDRNGEHVGLIHRDISPHNILLSTDGAVKLVDFGVAKAQTQSHKTETGAVKGKFAYMAPEQIESGDLDRRVDVFAVGVLFYEMLTGEKPFGDDLKAVSMILSAVSPDPRDSRIDIPDEIAAIIDKALQRNREDRYSSAAEMEAVLQQYLDRAQKNVRTRELSVMVRQVLEMGPGRPTEQLHGFEKYGVERKAPRMTQPGTGPAPEPSGEREASNPAVRLQGNLGGGGANTSQEIPSVKGVSGGANQEREAQGGGMSLKLVLAFVVMAILVLASAGGAFWIFIVSGSEDAQEQEAVARVEAVSVEEAAEAPVEERADEPARETTASWNHPDGMIVSIVTSPSAELYRSDRKVGETPFQTNLRPGRYFVEFRAGEKRESVEIVVVEGNPIQRFRFDL